MSRIIAWWLDFLQSMQEDLSPILSTERWGRTEGRTEKLTYYFPSLLLSFLLVVGFEPFSCLPGKCLTTNHVIVLFYVFISRQGFGSWMYGHPTTASQVAGITSSDQLRILLSSNIIIFYWIFGNFTPHTLIPFISQSFHICPPPL